MKATPEVKDVLITLAKEKKIYLEGNILKVLKADDNDVDFEEYLKTCKQRDVDSRKKRLQVTKQVQKQNQELEKASQENQKINQQLSKALDKASQSAEEALNAKAEAEKLRDAAVEDLDTLQKRTQFELIGLIVKVALWVIACVGFSTTLMYLFVLIKGLDATIIESTWANLFGILLTNSFSIIGTIMGVKYATSKSE